jgi:hypothetical protein
MFNPFGKNFGELTEDNLQVLRTINEGWYIEYKSERSRPEKIAKTIASFANSYGGLYIIGVNAGKQTNGVIDFPGVDANLDDIHDAVKGNLNPFPHFDCYTVSLKNGKHIIIVAVEEGFDPPYIHNDGRIYRRQESSSDPIAATNRYSIDQLYEKAGGYKEKLKNFRTIDYGFCKGEDDWSYLIGYVNTRRLDKSIIDDFREPDFQSKILGLVNKKIDIDDKYGKIRSDARIFFNNITIFPDSLIVRNISSNIEYNSLTVELFINGSMKFLLPISTLKNPPALKSYRTRKNIDTSVIKFVNIENLCTQILNVFITYFRFLKTYNFTDSLEIVFEGNNVWKHCLFSDKEEYFDYIDKFSLPIVIKHNIMYPEKAFKVHFANDTKAKGIDGSVVGALSTILALAISGFGMPYGKSLLLYISEAAKEAVEYANK